jgi:ferritin-like protein
MKTQSIPKTPILTTESKPPIRMENDPRFLTLLAGAASGAITQFEVYRITKGMDYEGEDLVQNLCEDEEERCEQQANRVWLVASVLYRRLTKKSEVREFNEKLA